jgi:hypothetical protein
MRLVRSQLVDKDDKLFGKEYLANVLSCFGRVSHVIFVNLGSHGDVDVGCTRGVVIQEDGQDLANSGLVGLGVSAQAGAAISYAVEPGSGHFVLPL